MEQAQCLKQFPVRGHFPTQLYQEDIKQEVATSHFFMAGLTYSCRACGKSLNLFSDYLFPEGMFFEAGNKGTLSFFHIDGSSFRKEEEKKYKPFWETRNYWGIQRIRTKLLCASCDALVGHIYEDGPPLRAGHGVHHFGPSQAIPRQPRYRMKINALLQQPPLGYKQSSVAPDLTTPGYVNCCK